MTPRKILFIGEFWAGATPAGLAGGLRRHGHLVNELDWRPYLAKYGSSIAGRIAVRLTFSRQIAAFNRAILDSVAMQCPDIVLTVKGSFIYAETIAAMQAKGVRCVNFYPDFSLDHLGLSLESLLRWDLLVTTKTFQIDWFRERMGASRVAFVHHGYVPDAHYPMNVPDTDADYRWDICYIGNPSPYKRAWLDAVCAAFPERKIAIAGNRWKASVAGTVLGNATILPAAMNEDFSRMAGSSRINLAIHYGPKGDLGWEDKVSTRSFELPACKAFMLHIDNDEIRSLYDVGREIDVFDTPAALVEKIGHYLDRATERQAMIDAAYARAVPAYSLDTRAAELMAVIEARQG
jgi:spore maturation protein CgeB